MGLIVLPLILGITFIIVFLGKEKFGYSVPVSIIISSLLLYFSQIIFSTFSVGLYTFIIAGISGCLLALVSAIGVEKSSRFKDAILLYFSPGFYAFIILFFFAFIAYGERYFSAWDELSHWGPMVKEMIRLDRFYIVSEARPMAHRDYAPIIQLFEYLICRFSGGYSEGKASVGVQLVQLSFVAPVLMEKIGGYKSENIRKKIGFNLILGFLAVVLTVLVFLWFDRSDIYRTIMNDCAVCAVGVYTLNLSLDEDILTDKTKRCYLILSMFYLPLCKQIAMAFVLLVYLSIAIAWVQGRIHKSGKKLSLIAFTLSVIIVPLLSFKLWAHIILPYNFTPQFDLAKVSITEIIRIILTGGNQLQYTTYMKYVASLFSDSVTSGPLAVGYISFCILGLFLLSLMHFSKGNVIEKISGNEYIKYILVFVAGMIGYAFTMFVMYMYGFSEEEMLALASFSRYMATYTCLMFFLLLYLFFTGLERKTDRSTESKNKYLIIIGITVLMFILVDQNRLPDFTPKVYGVETKVYQVLASEIDNHAEFDDTVLLVSENNNMYGTFLRYYCNDALVSGVDYLNGVPEEDLATYDYVYVINTNDFLNEQWGQMLEVPSDSISAGIYAVVNIDGTYRLRFVE